MLEFERGGLTNDAALDCRTPAPPPPQALNQAVHFQSKVPSKSNKGHSANYYISPSSCAQSRNNYNEIIKNRCALIYNNVNC